MRRALLAMLVLGCASPSAPPVDPTAPAATPPAKSAPAEKPPAEAAPLTPPASPGDEQADFAASLFLDACVAHITKPVELMAWIREKQLGQVDPELAARILAGEQGEVWAASNELGQFFVIVNPINPSLSKCAVWAHRANVARLNGHFERLLQGASRPGLVVEKVVDEEIQGPGGGYRQLVYFLRNEKSELGWVFVAITSASEEAEIQGRLVVAPGQGKAFLAPGPPGGAPQEKE